MRAWVARAYGGPEVLTMREVPRPKPGARELLIRVEATTVSAADIRIRSLDFPKGLGWIGRLLFGMRRPRRAVLGVEVTGIVAAIGAQVSRFAVGDAVIAFPGAQLGAHAEYVVVADRRPIVRRPAAMPIETAAALAFGGLTARDFLRRAAVQPGEHVLVIGASGTVGSALVQLARDAGAEVAGVASAANLERVRGLGAVNVIDYTRCDVTEAGVLYDIVADAVGALNFPRALPILAEGGRYLAINGTVGDMLRRSHGSRRSIAGPSAEREDDLAALVALALEDRFQPLIDSVVGFEAMAAAHAKADSRRKRGSIVVRCDTA
jgi:NADPH:quinone reductase-like Zn-dependent oxidoreductase